MNDFINALVMSALDFLPIHGKDTEDFEVQRRPNTVCKGVPTHPHGREEKMHEVRRDHVSFNRLTRWDSKLHRRKAQNAAQEDIDDWLLNARTGEMVWHEPWEEFTTADEILEHEIINSPGFNIDWEMMVEEEKARELARPYIYPATRAANKLNHRLNEMADAAESLSFMPDGLAEDFEMYVSAYEYALRLARRR